MIAGRLALILLLPVVASCAPESQHQIEVDVAQIVEPGMPTEDALTAIREAGFACRPGEAVQSTACTRERWHSVLGRCFQRVILVDERGTIRRIEVPPPTCK
jgi:hypothetical protein